MNRPITTTITLSGVDERVTGAELNQLLSWPGAELGLLYTATPEGRNRYPERAWLAWAAELAAGRCAVHVCGRGARAALLAGEIGELVGHAGRIQVNGVLSVEEVERICARYPDHTILTQHHDGNLGLLQVAAANHALLVDASGGGGQLPGQWQRPETGKRVGFAGGLGPHNLAEQWPSITKVAGGRPFWVDMEGRLRREDWFDVAAARAVLQAHARLLNPSPPRPPLADRRRRP